MKKIEADVGDDKSQHPVKRGMKWGRLPEQRFLPNFFCYIAPWEKVKFHCDDR